MSQPSTVDPPSREVLQPVADAASSPPRDRPRTPYRSHLLCYGILSCLFAYAIIARHILPLWSAEPIGVAASGPAAPLTLPAIVDQRIDPNTAGWVELTRLPGIGEVMAKRIVAYREERQQASGGGAPVFGSLADLGQVRGIGDKTLERLAPHLRMPTEP